MEHVPTDRQQKRVRLFVAAEIPIQIKHELSCLQKSVQESGFLAGTYPKPEAMHLTLKFIGDVSQDRVPAIQNVLRSIKYKSLEARLSTLAFFGNTRTPKIMYVDVDCPGLADLVRMMDDLLKDFCMPEEREFKSHLTIVRITQTIDSEGMLRMLDQMDVKKLSFSIDHFNLMQSRLNSEGPVPTTIERYDFMP